MSKTPPKKRPPRRARQAKSAALKAEAAAKGLPPPKQGQPTALTEQVSRKIVGALALGSYMETAIAVGGISRQTFYDWIKRGHAEKKRRAQYEADMTDVKRKTKRWAEAIANESVTKAREEPYVAFLEAVTTAVAAAEVEALGIVGKVARGSVVKQRIVKTNPADGSTTTTEIMSEPDWRAAAWRLERRHPAKWGRRVIDVNATVDAAVIDAQRLHDIAEATDPDAGKNGGGSGARERLAAALAKLLPKPNVSTAAPKTDADNDNPLGPDDLGIED